MTAQPQATSVPPVEVVLGDTIASLALAAHAYLAPPDESVAPDLAGAEILIDLAGAAFDRISPRLQPEERSALARLLTDLRLTFVQKRGL
ncbi:MAG: hypothetical protein WAJ85_14860 [Candidatus Baltobacteraceae bacterium]|jgi:hypothetical protein